MTPRGMTLYGSVKRHCHIILIGLSLSLLFSVSLAVKPNITHGIDSEVFYVGARLLASGHNPYDDRQLQNMSREVVPGGIMVGTASQAQITLPALLAVDTLLCGLSWPQFSRLEVVADAFCIPVIASLCLSYLRKPQPKSVLWLSSFGIALFPPTWKVVAVGQTTLLVLLCLLALLRASRHRQPIPTAVFCFLSLLKITCVLPLLLYLLFRGTGRQRVALLAGAALFSLVNAFVIFHLGVKTFLHCYQQNMSSAFSPGMVNDAYGAGQGIRIDVESILATVFTRQSGAIVKALLAVAALVPIYHRLRTVHKINLPEISSLCLLSLLFFYHRPYDAVLVVPALFLVYQKLQKHQSRIVTFGLSLLLLFCYLSFGDHNIVDPVLHDLHRERPPDLNAAIILLTYVFVILDFPPGKTGKSACAIDEARPALI